MISIRVISAERCTIRSRRCVKSWRSCTTDVGALRFPAFTIGSSIGAKQNAAISLAQGLVMQAKVGGLRVVQHDAKGNPIEIPVSYNKIMDGKEKAIQLAAGDIVYVPISKTKAVLASSTTLIGQTTAATIYTVF